MMGLIASRAFPDILIVLIAFHGEKLFRDEQRLAGHLLSLPSATVGACREEFAR